MTKLKNVRMSDTQKLSSRVVTRNGYLRAPANFSRTGIYKYTGAELGILDEPNKIFNIFRPRDEVFSDESLESFSDLPVTLGHPPEMLDAINTKQYSVGYSGTEVERFENFVKGEVTIFDQHAIDSVNKGESEISLGYVCDYEETSGETLGGDPYDLIQRNILGNHIAIVGCGRAGEKCEIYDSQILIREGEEMPKKSEKTDKETNDADVAELVSNNTEKTTAIKPDTQDLEIKPATIDGELKGMLDGIMERMDKMEKDLCAMGSKDQDIEEKEEKDAANEEYDQKEGEEMADKKMNDSVMQLATELVEVREKAKVKFPSIALDGKSPDQIIREVVVNTFTAENFDDASNEYIKGRFDALPAKSNNRQSYMEQQLSVTTRDSRNTDKSEAQKAFDETKDKYKK